MRGLPFRFESGQTRTILSWRPLPTPTTPSQTLPLLFQSGLHSWRGGIVVLFPKSDGFFLTVTQLADPLYAFLFLVPIAAGLHTSFGTDILVATVVAEWSNTLLKCSTAEDGEIEVRISVGLLMEDRPFWWVRETNVYGKGDLARFPKLRQTPLTCETGPGSPSGHVMGYGAVAYCLVVWFIKMFVKNNKKLSARTKSRVVVSVWILYAVTIVLVALSRLYVATHFPHQCLLGALGVQFDLSYSSPMASLVLTDRSQLTALKSYQTKLCIPTPNHMICKNMCLAAVTSDGQNLGVLVAWVLTSPQSWVCRWWSRSSRPILILAALFTTLLSVGAYWLQRLLGVDPQWSIKLAFKWCESPDFLHVNTTPLFSLVRSCGALLGIALATPLAARSRVRHNPAIGLVCAIFLGWAFKLATETVPTGDVKIFYICQFLLHAVEPYLLLVAVPRLCSLGKSKLN
uniref:glucose-6-phosphatase n=1 Tax=Timema californicum TaxID=61474 RepID=A0A7R9JCX0_TIMCA|nr:unnamed protein product [Timema californicum]